MKEELRRLTDFCEKERKIYCYGAGLYGKVVGIFLDDNNIKWNGFVVSSKSEEGTLLGRNVISLAEVQSEDAAFLVSVNEKYHGEIEKILSENGFDSSFCVTDGLYQEIFENLSYKKEYRVNKNINVLLYHRIIDLELDTWKLAVSPDHFDEQMKYLKKHYKILRFEDDWTETDEKSVVITFDDGYFDNYRYALPILEKYGIHATFFVSSGHIDDVKEFWWDELERMFFCNSSLPDHIYYEGLKLPLDTDELKREACYFIHPYIKKLKPEERNVEIKRLKEILNDNSAPRQTHRTMSSDELKKLAASELVTIGAHTVTHTALSRESYDEQLYEIKKSKEAIENIVDKRVNVFSYPFGGRQDYNSDTIRVLTSLSFTKSASGFWGVSDGCTDVMQIPRNGKRDMDLNDFVRSLNYTWYMCDVSGPFLSDSSLEDEITSDIYGQRIPVLRNNIFTNRQNINWDDVEKYLVRYVNTCSQVIETNDVIHIGNEFPDEYSGSNYTRALKGTRAKAKANAAQAISRMIRFATNKKYKENYKAKHSSDAAKGWYYYDTRFAVPVYKDKIKTGKYNFFLARLVVNHATNDKLYLYDIIDIKKEASNPLKTQ